jgi:hypothetical protein
MTFTIRLLLAVIAIAVVASLSLNRGWRSSAYTPETPSSAADTSEPRESGLGGALATTASGSAKISKERHYLAQDRVISSAMAEPNVFATLIRSVSFIQGMNEAALIVGRDSAEYASAYMQVSSACTQASDIKERSLRTATPIDPATNWAVEQLLNRCAGWTDLENLAPIEATPDLYSESLRRQPAETSAAALNLLESALDARHLAQAMETLFNNNALPEQALPNNMPSLTRQEILSSMWTAAILRECEVSRACGAGSLAAVSFCSMHACRPNATFLDAVREALPLRQLETIFHFQRWLTSKHRQST